MIGPCQEAVCGIILGQKSGCVFITSNQRWCISLLSTDWTSWWFFSKYMSEVTTVDMRQLKELTV